jgi:hypothetical protein
MPSWGFVSPSPIGDGEWKLWWRTGFGCSKVEREYRCMLGGSGLLYRGRGIEAMVEGWSLQEKESRCHGKSSDGGRGIETLGGGGGGE